MLKELGYGVSIHTFSKSFFLPRKGKALNKLVLFFLYMGYIIELFSRIFYALISRRSPILYYYGRSKTQFWLLFLFKILLRIQLIVHISEYEPSFFPSGSNRQKSSLKLYDSFAKRADKFVFISNYSKEYFLSNHCFSKTNTHYESAYILPPLVSVDKILSAPDVSRNRPYVLYSANLAEYLDDAIFVIKAFARASEKNIDLILIGKVDKQTLGLLIKQAKLLGVRDRVVFIDKYLSNKNLFSFMKGASVLLSPLRDNIRNSNRFPYKLAQYMSSGSMVITSPVGEVARVLDNTKTVLFSPYSTRDFSKTIERSLKEDCKEYIYNALDFAKEYFDYKSYKNSFDEFLQS